MDLDDDELEPTHGASRALVLIAGSVTGIVLASVLYLHGPALPPTHPFPRTSPVRVLPANLNPNRGYLWVISMEAPPGAGQGAATPACIAPGSEPAFTWVAPSAAGSSPAGVVAGCGSRSAPRQARHALT